MPLPDRQQAGPPSPCEGRCPAHPPPIGPNPLWAEFKPSVQERSSRV